MAMKNFGGIDIVVNNAAILRDAFVFRMDPRDWDAVIRTNLSAAFYLINAASGGDARAGQIGARRQPAATTGAASSTSSRRPASTAIPARRPTPAPRPGCSALTRVAAMDLQRAQITVNAVAPFARTRVTDIIQPANEAQKTYKERALKIGAHHVANLVTALCARPAGKAITGQLLGVRGREVFLFGQPRPVAQARSRQAPSDAGPGARRPSSGPSSPT